jgi:hypothetical protein
MLEEGLLVVASCLDRLVVRGQIPCARWWGAILHGHVGLLPDDVVVLVVLIFLVGGREGGEGGLGDRVRLPRLVVLVEGGAAARLVLPDQKIVAELEVPVLAVLPWRLGEIVDAAAYLRI